MSQATVDASDSGQSSPVPQLSATKERRKLILCFDGTGNTFSGSNADTNVVKLLNKLDRNDPNQFHYYQTGIGTYDVGSTTVDQSWLASIRSSISQTMDQGFGTGFDAHVMAGYRFLMRYYESGDRIYMFGFSRGAFTAKFLARMIHTVGLLCRGNEEMVPFAYRLYQRYLAGQIHEFDKKGNRKHTIYDPDHDVVDDPKAKDDEITIFSNTFCRKELLENNEDRAVERNIKVFFLGMWDCVNSVAVLESKSPKPVPICGTAKYVRHAVSVDERRVKFKAALLAQDIRASADNDEFEDIKEVWFPGCHGDVGGGWPASTAHPFDMCERMTTWQHIKNVFTTRKAAKAARDMDSGPLQMSDIALAWMIDELAQMRTEDAVKWRQSRLSRFRDRFQKKKKQALRGVIHDSLRYGHGTGFPKVLFWKFLEWLPFIKRWELVGNDWKELRFPLNKGATRDIPPDATLHESLIWRLQNVSTYQPRNNHGGDTSPCLTKAAEFEDCPDNTARDTTKSVGDHKIYRFKGAPKVPVKQAGGSNSPR